MEQKREKELSNDWTELRLDEIHKPIKRRFTKGKGFSYGFDNIWSADLHVVEMQKLSKWNKSKNIKYATENEEKSSVFERWNRTIKNKMWKMFSANNKTIYYDKVEYNNDEYNNEYNNDYHLSIKMTPAKASQNKNEKKVFANLYGH